MKKRRIGLLFVLMMLLVATALPAQAATLKLNKKKVTIYAGKTVQLKVVGAKSKAKWASSNRAVATVSENGKVAGKKAGKVNISARVGSKKLKCTVTVKTVLIKKIKLSKYDYTMNVGGKLTLKPIIKPSNASDKRLKWTSDDPAIATVDQNGVVTARKAGTVAIYGNAKDGSYIDVTCTITVDGNSENSRNTSSAGNGSSNQNSNSATNNSNEGSGGNSTSGNSGNDSSGSGSAGASMVWIPRTGSKYHSYSGCSGMRSPSYVSIGNAIAWGYTACSKCW